MKDTSKKEVEEILAEQTRHIGNQKKNVQEFLGGRNGYHRKKLTGNALMTEVNCSSDRRVRKGEMIDGYVNQLSGRVYHSHARP